MKPSHNRKRNVVHGKAMHTTLKSSVSVFVSKQSRHLVERLIIGYAKYFKVKVYHRALLSNHIHLIVKPESASSLSGFLRVLSGQLAERLKTDNAKPFWQSRPWSRVLQWGKDYGIAQKYVVLNYLQSIGKIIRTKHKHEMRNLKWLIDEVLEGKWTVPGALQERAFFNEPAPTKSPFTSSWPTNTHPN